MKQVSLSVDSVLEYVDQPQVFIARDEFDTMYLCLLFEDERYTAIRVSHKRLSALQQHEADLLSLYAQPETEGEYFDVRADSTGILTAAPLSQLSADRLPAEGFYLSPPVRETVTVEIPVSDKSFFTSIVRRFGWVAM